MKGSIFTSSEEACCFFGALKEKKPEVEVLTNTKSDYGVLMCNSSKCFINSLSNNGNISLCCELLRFLKSLSRFVVFFSAWPQNALRAQHEASTILVLSHFDSDDES